MRLTTLDIQCVCVCVCVLNNIKVTRHRLTIKTSMLLLLYLPAFICLIYHTKEKKRKLPTIAPLISSPVIALTLNVLRAAVFKTAFNALSQVSSAINYDEIDI